MIKKIVNKRKVRFLNMKNKIRISNICLAIVFLIAFTFFVIQANKEEELIQTSAEIALSNQRIGWGVKRLINIKVLQWETKIKNMFI